jgi:hypothetical protein
MDYLIDPDWARREYEERLQAVAWERRIRYVQPKRPGIQARLLQRLGDHLIAFRWRLKVQQSEFI